MARRNFHEVAIQLHESDKLVVLKKGLKSGDIVKQIAPIIGGGGGGKPDMAQAGGKNPAKLPDALRHADKLGRELLAK